MLCEPEVAFAPLHDPDAVQPVELVVLQANVELPPLNTLVGDAVNVSVGAPGAAMPTDTERVTDPPVPVHTSA